MLDAQADGVWITKVMVIMEIKSFMENGKKMIHSVPW